MVELEEAFDTKESVEGIHKQTASQATEIKGNQATEKKIPETRQETWLETPFYPAQEIQDPA